MKKELSLSIAVLFSISNFFGQNASIKEMNQNHVDWHSKDLSIDSKAGVSVRKAYLEFLKEKKSRKTVVVAVIDSGVDIKHEDLQGKIWVNKNEIPNNNIDDDDNGYIDDIHGWSFLGNSSGENTTYANYEYVRIVKKNDVTDPSYKAAKKIYDKEFKENSLDRKNIKIIEEVLGRAKEIIKENTGIEINSPDDLIKVTSTVEEVTLSKNYLQMQYDNGLTEEILAEFKERNDIALNYHINTEFNPRKLIGDDPFNMDDKNYGNSDVTGPTSSHGTSVAGVIAAVRDNGIGIDGIATDVKIMVLRAVPDGDELDKDVALAIIYAVDNGADIINMSFGKKFSPNKEFVDKAIKYAEEHSVLLVHAAGNEGDDIDVNVKYPSKIYNNGKSANNYLTIGASDAELNKDIAAIFSNYGAIGVDLFAPGVNIVSLDTGNTYSAHNGTSLSSPVVSGVAALVLSYYPDLKAKDLKSILQASCTTFKKPKKVYIPGRNESKKRAKTSFSKLSNTGGIVNAYNALVEAEKRNKNQ